MTSSQSVTSIFDFLNTFVFGNQFAIVLVLSLVMLFRVNLKSDEISIKPKEIVPTVTITLFSFLFLMYPFYIASNIFNVFYDTTNLVTNIGVLINGSSMLAVCIVVFVKLKKLFSEKVNWGFVNGAVSAMALYQVIFFIPKIVTALMLWFFASTNILPDTDGTIKSSFLQNFIPSLAHLIASFVAIKFTSKKI